MIQEFGARSRAARVRARLSFSLSVSLSLAIYVVLMMLCSGAANAQVRGVRPPDVPGWFGIFNAPRPPCGERSFGLYCYIGASGTEAKQQVCESWGMEPLGPLDYDLTPAMEATWGPVDCISANGVRDSVQLYAAWVCDHNGTFAKLYDYAPGQKYASCIPPGAPDPKKSNGCSPNNMGHPCNAATGNKFLSERDYAGSGALPLTITRYYNSAASNQTALGVGWVLSYERVLKLTPGKPDFKAPDVVAIQRADGSVLTFDFSNGVWISDADVRATLNRSIDVAGNLFGWIFVDLVRDETETYDAAGKLISIRNRAGLTQSLTYDSSGRLASVSDAVGRTLTVSYESSGRIAGITDPAGSVYAYSYDTAGNLAGATFPDGATRRYLYEDAHFPNALTGVIDENGNRYVTYTYDEQGRMVREALAGGAEPLSFSDDTDVTTTVTDGLGVSRTFSLSSIQAVKRVTSSSLPCPGCAASGTWDSQTGLPILTYDFNGQITSYGYDSRGRETSRQDGGPIAEGHRTVSTQWHDTLNLPLRIAGPSRITTLAYDAHGNLASKSEQPTLDLTGARQFNATVAGTPRNTSYTNTYSSTVSGLMTRQVIDGPRTDVADLTISVWDESGNLVSITDALRRVTTLGNYDAHGHARTVTDPNGLVTRLSYDARGRLTALDVGGETTSYEYDLAGQLKKLTAPGGAFVVYTYDAAHRVIELQDASGNTVAYTHDVMGNVTQTQTRDPAGTLARMQTREYDLLNRLSKDIGAVHPAAQVTRYAYDNGGNLQSVTDPLGNVTSHVYDPLNRVKQVIEPAAKAGAAAATTEYTYDLQDNITAIRTVDPSRIPTRYTFDGLGNLTAIDSPEAGITQRLQDAAGNLISETDPRGVVTTYRYDALDRVIAATYTPPAGSSIAPASIAYNYDQGTYGIGHLTGITDPSGTSSYAYDQKGRLVQEVRTIASASYTTRYNYDGFGRLSGVTYPSGRTLAYSFDAGSRIKQIDTGYLGSSQAIVSNIAYQPFGSVKSWTFGNAQAYGRSYDLDGRVSGYTLGNFSRSLVIDDASRIVGYTHADPAVNATFSYDNVNRLINWSAVGTAQSFDYDVTGNRASQVIGANSYNYGYWVYGARTLQSVDGPTMRSYQYDAAGNTVNDGRAFAYDARGRLINAQSGSVRADYMINALGQRVSKTIVGAETNVFHYDVAGHLIGESDATGNPRREYIWLGDTPVAVVSVAASQTASCAVVPGVNSGTSFVAFNDNERMEVKGGKSGSGDWEWALGVNTQASGQFVSSNLTWSSKKSYGWTLSYDGKGNGTYTVLDGSKKLFSKTFKKSGTKLLRTGNAIEFRVRSSAGIPAGNSIAVVITNVNGTAFNQKLATSGNGSASEQKLFIAGTNLVAKFTVKGTITLTFTGKTPPLAAALDLLVNAGNVTCNQPSQAKAELAYIQTDQIDTPRTVTNAAQKVIWQWDDLDPFGANIPNEDPDGDGSRFTLNLRFAGQYFDRETGLHYNYFRDYDPQTGRYVQSDPVGLAGGIRESLIK